MHLPYKVIPFKYFMCIILFFSMATRAAKIRDLWAEIQDIIGPANFWPHLIRRLFWTRNINHFQRILVCTFVFINALNPEVFIEWAQLMHLCRDRAADNHIRAFFRLLANGRNYNLYAFHVLRGRYEYLDGRVRRYTHGSLR